MTNEAVTETRTELAKGYEHRDAEARWYRVWKERGYFHADEHDGDRPPFSIVLPPPNVTGSLHLGHALTATLQDVLIRWKRMSGFNALWLPGTDHAGIATQMIVEKELQKSERKSRHDLGRAEFLKRVWTWKEKFGSRIGEQHEALGASLDWDRERFTMDEGLSRAVREVFVRLYEEGLIYREKKLINWCPDCRTALSDLEVTYDDAHQGELWSFAYPLSDGSGEIVVATTRPETMLGDTAVAVHPEDERYKQLIGKKVVHPLVDREIPIIADEVLVDPAFGTGAVKVTPAHDFNDFEVGRRHGLEMLTVIDLDGRMNQHAGPVAGMDRFDARRRVKELLAEKGLDRGSKAHVLPLGKCQRSETVLEPLLSQQWFVKIEPLATPAIRAVEEGKTRFIPEQWTNTYMAWMRNIHDWCISRQLWWGHQIPAWYCPEGHVTVAREAPITCAHCRNADLRQDEDVLDTWFSSALWPFSTMGWPERTATLQTFYPTSVMETGHDIIFFWVARMMMMGIHCMGEVPFRVVYLHPMVRDEKGQKMSKTKGNVIDPLVITEQYGADALRFTLAALTAQGRDIKLAKERIEGYRAFANKLWNAARFALMNLAGFALREGEDAVGQARSAADRWILARLQRAVNDTVDALEGFRFNDAANAVYQFIWHELCDWYIELAKDALYGADEDAKRSARVVLTHCLDTSLRLLHPMMPFITEELWQTLQAQVGARWGDSIMVAPYPGRGSVDESAERGFGPVIGLVEALRNIRGEMNVAFKVPFRDVHVGSLSPEAQATIRDEESRIVRLANIAGLFISTEPTPKLPGSAVAVGNGFEVRVPLAGIIDMTAEGARVAKELAKVEADLGGIEKKLSNPSFVERAPKDVVEKDRARAEELRTKRTRLEAHRTTLEEAARAAAVASAVSVEQPPTSATSVPEDRAPVVADPGPRPTESPADTATVTPTGDVETASKARPVQLVPEKPAASLSKPKTLSTGAATSARAAKPLEASSSGTVKKGQSALASKAGSARKTPSPGTAKGSAKGRRSSGMGKLTKAPKLSSASAKNATAKRASARSSGTAKRKNATAKRASTRSSGTKGRSSGTKGGTKGRSSGTAKGTMKGSQKKAGAKGGAASRRGGKSHRG